MNNTIFTSLPAVAEFIAKCNRAIEPGLTALIGTIDNHPKLQRNHVVALYGHGGAITSDADVVEVGSEAGRFRHGEEFKVPADGWSSFIIQFGEYCYQKAHTPEAMPNAPYGLHLMAALASNPTWNGHMMYKPSEMGEGQFDGYDLHNGQPVIYRTLIDGYSIIYYPNKNMINIGYHEQSVALHFGDSHDNLFKTQS